MRSVWISVAVRLLRHIQGNCFVQHGSRRQQLIHALPPLSESWSNTTSYRLNPNVQATSFITLLHDSQITRDFAHERYVFDLFPLVQTFISLILSGSLRSLHADGARMATSEDAQAGWAGL